ncbi:MAG: hypothetical protein WC389_01260 [Lutibacter sp.]|jgi:hypothetical protein
MTTFILIILGVGFIIYLFNNDRKDVKTNVLQRGGMITIYPNFNQYINQAKDTSSSILNFDTTHFELVKNDGEYLEYKFPVFSGNEISGYFFIGLQHSFGTIAYCYCRTKGGKKIEGFMRELHNGRDVNKPRDRDIEDYRGIFFNLIKQMKNLQNFEEQFYFNN